MPTPKRVHVIACAVLALDLKAIAQRFGIDISFDFLPGGLHNTPHELRRRLQEAIDLASSQQRGDMIAIGYGLCGRGTVGLHARQVPLTIPRVHDCIALFLGSDAAYREQFTKYPGTYYISAGWVEEKVEPKSQADQLGKPPGNAAERAFNPNCQDAAALIEKYGQENAEAIRQFLSSWQRNYQRAAFIDTGVPGRRRRYEEIAQAMAREFGWKYEELAGTGELLTQLLTAQRTTPEILVVPPHHVTADDPLSKGLKAVPVWETQTTGTSDRHTLVFDESAADGEAAAPSVRLGLGIDAGGTYTDAAIYDFAAGAVVEKAKALTTKWDYTIGIGKALDQLDRQRLAQVDLVSISTTLATNAIVEGRGQRVGLLLMPPYGRYDPTDVSHLPQMPIEGKMEIDGTEIAPINPQQVRQAAREMVEHHRVGAFAVAGFAGHHNPAHELAVKRIIQDETGLSVTCGHEVSELFRYDLRAQTAALNARIIPFLEALLDHVEKALRQRGIAAPIMVVKSDGSLMDVNLARQRPIETILSGPAASVAGARFLAKCTDALVVDVGGTTTDTAIIQDGQVRTNDDGATVGGWKTHVRALDMRTLGLGGDSLIAWEKHKLHIGPLRVGPVSWLAAQNVNVGAALDWLDRHADRFDLSTRRADLFLLNGHKSRLHWSAEESQIIDLLGERPHSIQELAYRASGDGWRGLNLERLEEHHVIQRCSLTPTDLLHAAGSLSLWDRPAAERACEFFCHLTGLKRDEFVKQVIRQVVHKLAIELLKKQLDGKINPDELDDSAPAQALLDNLLAGGESGESGGGGGGGGGFRVRVQLGRPVVGIGAPVHFFLPAAAKILETQAIIPPHADVANAIGAITSSVFIHKQVKISPNEQGRYGIYGLPDAPVFSDFQEAHQSAVTTLLNVVRQEARQAGTSQTRVEIVVDDQVAPLADGGLIFLGRTLEARLSGRPDVMRMQNARCKVQDAE